VRQENFDFFFGSGSNGKGTFLRTVSRIMGDYALGAPIGMFMASRFESHPPELARLAHCRLVTASEIEKGQSWALGKIKDLTGNEKPVVTHFMRQDEFQFWPHFKLVFAANEKPRISSVDKAIARRLNLVPFQHVVGKPDESLKAKLEVEYPAILRWMIDGCRDWLQGRPCRPAVVVEARREYLEEENIVEAWIAECCERGPGYETLLKHLFGSWKIWCDNNAEKPGSSRAFKRLLLKVPGIGTDRKADGIVMTGLRIRPVHE
jgi:putative DNA primase/helicase